MISIIYLNNTTIFKLWKIKFICKRTKNETVFKKKIVYWLDCVQILTIYKIENIQKFKINWSILPVTLSTVYV